MPSYPDYQDFTEWLLNEEEARAERAEIEASQRMADSELKQEVK